MRYRYIFSVGLLLSLSYVCLQAQTRQSAIDRYHDGGQKPKRETERAIEDFRDQMLAAGGVKSSLSSPQTNGFTAASMTATTSPSSTRLLPTPTRRGLARYRQGDVDGAIADWDAAIRSSRSALPYTTAAPRATSNEAEPRSRIWITQFRSIHSWQRRTATGAQFGWRSTILRGRWPILIKRSL